MLRVAEYLYGLLMHLVVRLAEHGLIHGDFNEFNLLVKETFIDNPHSLMDQNYPASEDPRQSPIIIIDFPQMISVQHQNAQEQFERDVNCLRTFFSRRFGFEPAEWPDFNRDVQRGDKSLDSELKASGHCHGASRDNDDTSDEEEQEEDCTLKKESSIEIE